MDVVDIAQEHSEQLLAAKLKDIQSRDRELNPNGNCYWCDEPFPPHSEKLFCDSDCSFDYERYERAQFRRYT